MTWLGPMIQIRLIPFVLLCLAALCLWIARRSE